MHRLVPWVGTVLMVMGVVQTALAASRLDEVEVRLLGTGLLIAGGGIGLVARTTHGARRWRFIGLGVLLGAMVAALIAGPGVSRVN